MIPMFPKPSQQKQKRLESAMRMLATAYRAQEKMVRVDSGRDYRPLAGALDRRIK